MTSFEPPTSALAGRYDIEREIGEDSGVWRRAALQKWTGSAALSEWHVDHHSGVVVA